MAKNFETFGDLVYGLFEDSEDNKNLEEVISRLEKFARLMLEEKCTWEERAYYERKRKAEPEAYYPVFDL